MSSLRPGQSWGVEESGPPDLEVAGNDAMLAAVLARGLADPLVRFAPGPDSDLARAVGLIAGAAQTGVALPLDVFDVTVDESPESLTAVNSIAVGIAPDRLRAWHRPAGLTVDIGGRPVDAAGATSLVVMNGQYLRGFDVSPRGHPGDGVAEAQLYALPRGDRRAMRARLPAGAHVPHPAITIRRAHTVVMRSPRPVPVELDGEPAGRASSLRIDLRQAAYRLLV